MYMYITLDRIELVKYVNLFIIFTHYLSEGIINYRNYCSFINIYLFCIDTKLRLNLDNYCPPTCNDM